MQYDSTLVFDSETIPGVTFTLHKPSYGRTLEFDRKNAGFRETSRQLQKRQTDLREELDFVRKQWDTEQESKLKELRKQLAEANEGDHASLQAQIDKIENGWEYERLIDRAGIVKDEEHTREIAEKLVAIGENKTVFQMPRELSEGFRQLREDAEFARSHDYYPVRLQWGVAKLSGIEIDGAPATAESLLQAGPLDLTREILQQIDTINSMTPEQLRNFKSPTTLTAAEGGPMSATIAENANSHDSTKAETA